MKKLAAKKKIKKVEKKKNVEWSLTIDELSDILDIELKKNCISLGFDVAERVSGIVILRTDNKNIYLDKNTIVEIKNKGKGNLHNNIAEFYAKLFQLLLEFKNTYKINKEEKIVIIEDCWFGQSVWTTKVLSKFATVVFLVFKDWTNNIPDPIQPRSARSKVGFNTDKDSKLKIKEQIQNWLEDNLDITLEDDNEADAFILALCGLINEKTT
jgi:Holliday junction resolvasome RuvABC endonuclease subunit